MADKRNRTPFYGAVPTSKLQADHVFMADGSTLQEQADREFELIETITLTEDVALIERDYNGQYSDILIDIYAAPAATASNIVFSINESYNTTIGSGIYTAARYSKCYAFTYFNMLLAATKQAAAAMASYGNIQVSQYTKLATPINKIQLIGGFTTNSVIDIYGVRA